MAEQQPQDHIPLPNSHCDEVLPQEDLLPNSHLYAWQAPSQSNPHERSSKRPHIKFYSGYSSFNYDILQKRALNNPTFDQPHIQGSPVNTISPEKPLPDQPHHQQPLPLKQELNLTTLAKNTHSSAQPQAQSGEVECKLEQVAYKKRVCQSYAMNKIYASISLQSREAMKRKLTRGMYSIASRKYQPIIDSREIFDDEELENNVLGPDQCRLWRNLMNKYFLRSSKLAKIKRKIIAKSEIKLKADQSQGMEELEQRKRGTRLRQKPGNQQQHFVKKQEEDPCQLISDNFINSQRNEMKNSEAGLLKKEEEQLEGSQIGQRSERNGNQQK